MFKITGDGYWAKQLGFTCQDCSNYKIETLIRCSLHRKLVQVIREIKLVENAYLQTSKPEKVLLITTLRDFFSEFNKSKILEERNQRELITDVERLYNELLNEKRTIITKIKRCLNKKHYLAVTTGRWYFYNQVYRIADCRMCQNYNELFWQCMLNHQLKKMRGKCSFYKFGKPMFPTRIMDEYLKLQNESE